MVQLAQRLFAFLDLRVKLRKQQTGVDTSGRVGAVVNLGDQTRALRLEVGQQRVQAGHRRNLLALAELDGDGTRGLEDTALRTLTRVHLHHSERVHERVNNGPRTAAQLSKRREIHKDRLRQAL